jgi:EH domain-containing protein 1
MLSVDITQLMQMLPREEASKALEGPQAKAGAFDDELGPFGIGQTEGICAGVGEVDWIVNRFRDESDDSFLTLNPVNNKVTGAAAKSEMVKSKLPNSVLGKIWKLADYDKDGMLDKDEWALAKYLIKIKLEGSEIPNVLPEHLIPPSKRKLFPELNNSNSDANSIRDE